MIREAIIKILTRHDLAYDEAYATMNEILGGTSTAVQNAVFLAAISAKLATSETVDEIAGIAAAARSRAPRVAAGLHTMDIGGTGGDGSKSFNISTTAAFVVAAGGVRVAKHGSRAESSSSGTADCLEALGINIEESPALCEEMLREAGMCFLFALRYHTSLRCLEDIRAEMGVRNVFNVLGPLTNPAFPRRQMLGVYDEHLVEPMAKVLSALGVERGLVVYGHDSMDEISVSAPTTVCEFTGRRTAVSVIEPEMFGLRRAAKADVAGGSPRENADITLRVLGGEKGPRRDIVVLNAGAGLMAAGVCPTIAAGVARAAELIDSGEAMRTLERVREASLR